MLNALNGSEYYLFMLKIVENSSPRPFEQTADNNVIAIRLNVWFSSKNPNYTWTHSFQLNRRFEITKESNRFICCALHHHRIYARVLFCCYFFVRIVRHMRWFVPTIITISLWSVALQYANHWTISRAMFSMYWCCQLSCCFFAVSFLCQLCVSVCVFAPVCIKFYAAINST